MRLRRRRIYKNAPLAQEKFCLTALRRNKGEYCMKTWKHWYFVAVFSLIGGVFYINAQDIIVLKDGNMIEAKVVEIAPSEIKYKRFDHLDGPTIVVPANDVLSIRYENGRVEIINAAPADVSKTTANDPNRFRFGINANAGGALGYIWEGGPGAGINIELGKGHFNSEINLMFPIGGFGSLFTFNYFWPSRIGGIYLGGGLGYAFYKVIDVRHYTVYNGAYSTVTEDRSYTEHSIPLGLNAGYKFVTRSGVYFRTGAFLGFDFGAAFLMEDWERAFYIKPDLAIGWTMR